MEGCKFTDTNLTLIVMDSNSSALPPFTTMIRLRNISALRSSVVVQTWSSANSSDVSPFVGIGGDLRVEVSNCTLVDGVDAFVVDVHNATMWTVINISVHDTVIRRARRSAVSVYRSANAVLPQGSVPATISTVEVRIVRSIVEVTGSTSGIDACGNDTMLQDFISGAAVPIHVLWLRDLYSSLHRISRLA
jgi:hypothetical protein